MKSTSIFTVILSFVVLENSSLSSFNVGVDGAVVITARGDGIDTKDYSSITLDQGDDPTTRLLRNANNNKVSRGLKSYSCKSSKSSKSKSSKSSKSKSSKSSKSESSKSSQTPDCEVSTICDLQNAIANAGTSSVVITLCPEEIKFEQEIPLIDKQLTFTCPNGGCVLDAESKSRLFRIGGTSNISFDGITFKNGNTSGDGGAILNYYGGSVTITACRFEGNTAIYGGAIANAGSVVITESEFERNTAEEDGGAIENFDGGTLDIIASNFEENGALWGGAIANTGEMDITGSNFNGNRAKRGNNIANGHGFGVVTCNVANTFNNPDGNEPTDLCDLVRITKGGHAVYQATPPTGG